MICERREDSKDREKKPLTCTSNIGDKSDWSESIKGTLTRGPHRQITMCVPTSTPADTSCQQRKLEHNFNGLLLEYLQKFQGILLQLLFTARIDHAIQSSDILSQPASNAHMISDITWQLYRSCGWTNSSIAVICSNCSKTYEHML